MREEQTSSCEGWGKRALAGAGVRAARVVPASVSSGWLALLRCL